MRHKTAFVLTVFVLGCFFVSIVSADVILPNVIDSNMVLQRDIALPIWGFADPGEKIEVTFAGNKTKAVADKKGNWQVEFPAMKAGGPHTMTVAGNNSIKLKNIMVGEVWICSGQSNMEQGMGMVHRSEGQIAQANYPDIRLFLVKRAKSGLPLNDLYATWKPCSPESIAEGGWEGFSGVAYYFGRRIHLELNVPVGLIATSWGGTRIEPWTPPVGFKAVPKLKEIVTQIDQAGHEYKKLVSGQLGYIEKWLAETKEEIARDKPIAALPPQMPKHPLGDRQKPTVLYNAMIHPLVPFAIRGAIWYQGESNRGDGMLYYEKMKALIGGWRSVWNQGDFPFYFVQLAPFQYGEWGKPSPLLLPEIWEAQTASLAIANTGMAVTVDIGNLKDIHPRNKFDVGERLALWAMAKDYGRTDIVYSGPLYKSMAVESNKIRISFDHLGTGLISADEKDLTWFEIAGVDKKFVTANAVIDGDTVVVSSQEVAKPAAVRFGWHHLAEPNLKNKQGLPASPFRTDKW